MSAEELDPEEPEPTLFDYAEARRRAEEGQARSELGRAELGELYDGAIARVARALHELSVDDVWGELGEVPELAGAASAMGPAMKRARRAGLIELTGAFVESRRPSNHAKAIRVYRSLVFGRPPDSVTPPG